MALGSSPAPDPTTRRLSGLLASVCPALGAAKAPPAPSVPHSERPARVPPLRGEAEGLRGFLGRWEEVAPGAAVRLPSSCPLIIIMSCLPISKLGTPLTGPAESRPRPLRPCFPQTGQDATGVRWGSGLREEERGRGDKVGERKENCSSQQAGAGVCARTPARRELGVRPSTFIRGSRPPNSWTGEPARAPPAPSPASPSPTGPGSPPRATVLIGWWAGEVLLQPSTLQTLAGCL